MSLVPVSFLDEYTKLQKQLVLDLSRDVVIGYASNTEEKCPNCYYDHVTGSSSSSFTDFAGTITLFSGTAYERSVVATPFRQRCPICSGQGLLKIPNEQTIPIHVIWETTRTDTYPRSEVGFSGQNVVTLKTNSKYYSDFLEAKYFVVDGVTVAPRSTPVIRGMGSSDGIVEIVCETVTTGKETNR